MCSSVLSLKVLRIRIRLSYVVREANIGIRQLVKCSQEVKKPENSGMGDSGLGKKFFSQTSGDNIFSRHTTV